MLCVCLWVLETSESWKTENTWEIAATFWRNFLNNCWPANVTHCAHGEMIGNSSAAEWIAKQILVEWRRYCYCTRVNNTVFVRRHRLDCWKDSVLSTVRRQGCHFDHTYASAPDNRHEEYFIARWAQSLKTLVWDLINMQNVLNHVSDRSSHLTGKQQIFFTIWSIVPSVLWRCWLGGRKGIRPVKKWVVRCWRGYLSGARCRLAYAQLMPLPPTVSCFSKIQIGFTFLVLAHPGSPEKRAVKRVCVCVRVCWSIAVIMPP